LQETNKQLLKEPKGCLPTLAGIPENAKRHLFFVHTENSVGFPCFFFGSNWLSLYGQQQL